MSKTFQHRVALAVGTLGLVWASAANAAPPASILGTWSIVGNQHVGSLNITSQGTGTCAPINGTIYSSNPVRGYYCPATGRIAFARKNTAGVVIQTWVGNVSDAGTPNRMGGTFHALDAAAGSGAPGEYHFQGQK
jgi:hypothetical protein